MKILLVDDDAFLRDMYAMKFGEVGHEVDVVDSATAAMSKIEQGEGYDLVLLDIVMPNMTGIDLLRECKQQFAELPTRYIVLSNQGQPDDISEAMAAGADGYIIKAESIPSEVVVRVEEILKEVSE